jgi:hypothetical protein
MSGTHGFRIGSAAIAVFLAVRSLVAASFAEGVRVALFPGSLAEISGLAHSQLNRDIFWVHNDSGDDPIVYAVSRTGLLAGSYVLEGASAVDWEDMAIGPARDGGFYLYLADIGDNTARRRAVVVYRVAEPRVSAGQAPVRLTLGNVAAFTFVYEDGPRDAEAFMIDPLTDDFYVVSKREPDGNRLYRATAPRTTRQNTLVRAGRFAFTSTTAADISADGMQVLIRRYSNREVDRLTPPEIAASYWSRPNRSVSLVDLLARPGQVVPLVSEAQGEAIAFAADGRGFYTTSERGTLPGGKVARAQLTYYRRLE